MKSLMVSLVVIACASSAFAGRGHHGGGGYGRGPGHGHGGGGYHHGGNRNDSNEVASILSAYTGALMLTSATACGSNDGCYYKQVIVDSKDDAAIFIATDGDQRGVKFNRAIELLRKMDSETASSDFELAADIINW
ncbi:DUF2388 domain-containing protein [Bdellovibrio sp. HCB209]|uniref:DUF2388 domain-containing protein n=1 Tax=Bdellovibrio sp. HCB209 TaxID=3394354 RepID=UPI0039B48163